MVLRLYVNPFGPPTVKNVTLHYGSVYGGKYRHQRTDPGDSLKTNIAILRQNVKKRTYTVLLSKAENLSLKLRDGFLVGVVLA